MIMASAACILCAYGARGQEIAALQRRMASGRDAVRVTETADAAAAVRAVEQRTKSTKVNGYTIVILFDNTQQARGECRQGQGDLRGELQGCEYRRYVRESVVYGVGRALPHDGGGDNRAGAHTLGLPKAFPRSAEMDIADFIIDPEAEAAAAESTAATANAATAAKEE